MGCCTSHQLPILPEDAQRYMQGLRGKHGSNILLMSVKDQNVPGKLSLCGAVTPELEAELTKVLQEDAKNKEVVVESDKYDTMYDKTWRNTSITSGHSMFSMAKSYFPRGRLFVSVLDVIARHGWLLSAAPNFGGVESRDDKGNVTSCVDWPVFVFYKDTEESRFASQHLMLAIKDSNVPGKVCAAGPVGAMEEAMTSKLKQFSVDVKSEKDSYDDDYDVVWRNTSITTGAAMLSLIKKYFPKGKVNVAMLECAYEHGWRVVACPNFGGQGDSWPCVVLRQLKEPPVRPPKLLFAAIKDANQPGKLCLSGPAARSAAEQVIQELGKLSDNAGVKVEKDSYDDDDDVVIHNVHITTGMAAFSLKLPYFPRGDSMIAFLTAMQAQGYSTVGCPNFGGMLDSWPSWIFEEDAGATPPLFLAVKDDNYPGKVDLGWGGGAVPEDPTLAPELFEVLKTLCGEAVTQAQDDYDKSFQLCFKNTRVTTGTAMFTMTKPYFPHGYVVEAVLTVMNAHGWVAVGGPNFGDNGNTWPGIVFRRNSA